MFIPIRHKNPNGTSVADKIIPYLIPFFIGFIAGFLL